MFFLALVAVTLTAGYWWGSTRSSVSGVDSNGVVSPEEKTGGKIKGQMKGKILYYRNPMGLPDVSAEPKKDPMGMDYIPVYEGEEVSSTDRVVKISTEKIQSLGVKTEAATMRELTRIVKAVSTAQPDERRLYTVAPKFEGWIERLYVNTTGQAVKKGDALMDVYSPELITAQHEYLVALKGTQMVEGAGLEARAGMRRLAESALQRLHNWDISDADIRSLLEEGQFKRSVTFRAPASGVVLEKSAIQGQRFEPGDKLYQIADLSTIWMLADVFEQDLALVQRGATATIRMDAYPDKEFNGEVAFIYPTIKPETRTAKVRIELSNREGLLKPAMYGRVNIASPHTKSKVLAVPKSAVLDDGIRQWVLVGLGEGRFQPREIKLGMRTDNYAEVVDGLTAGEIVVVKANFLIDAESNLRAALSDFGHSGHGEQPAEPKETRDKPEIRQDSSGANPDAPPVSHRGEGAVEAIDLTEGTITLAHGPIPSLSWPAMTMDFHVSDPALISTLKPGQKITFKITEERGKGYTVVSIKAIEPYAPVSPTTRDSKGHRDGR
jgi:Cu(I)/Ag(I) efflux system membrane fusion protein